MGTSSWLATLLDQEMLESRPNVSISHRLITDSNLPPKTGREVADELGGRYLLRYMLPHQVGKFTNGSNNRQYVTPTAYSPEETISWLALPAPILPRPYALILDPAKMPHAKILGPRWVRLGMGIEYILPDGFPPQAIVGSWEILVR